MNHDYLHPREKLAAIMHRIYRYRMTTTSGGNLSLVDDEGVMWITPSQVDKGGLTAADIAAVHSDGRIVGPHPPSSEYPFHRQIYAARPDIRAVLHAHPVALVAFSVVRQIPNTRCYAKALGRCGRIALASYGLPGSEELGANIASVFRDGADVAVLENHGVVMGAATIDEAFARFELLELFCRSLIHAARIGSPRPLSAEDENAMRLRPPSPAALHGHYPCGRERELRGELSRFIRRGYEQGLFAGIQGTFSARVGPDRFLITPKQADRRDISAAEFCLVQNGQVQVGREASLAAAAHRAIYECHPDVGAIINAAPPAALAFAMTDVPLDARTIPESYIFLKEVPRLAFQTAYNDPEAVAAATGLAHPVTLINNDGLMVVARSVFEAFDRLEVAEATAQSLIESSALGPVHPMDDHAIAELRRVFG